MFIFLEGYQREDQRRMQEQIQMLQASDAAWGNNCKDDVESIAVSVDDSVLPGAVEYHKRYEILLNSDQNFIYFQIKWKEYFLFNAKGSFPVI